MGYIEEEVRKMINKYLPKLKGWVK